MTWITDVETLEGLYGPASKRSIIKVAPHITPEYAAWINASKLCVLSTVGADSTDGSPRGDDGPVVKIANSKTLIMPDWPGNNRLDSLRNIVSDGRVSLMFIVRDNNSVVRVNGTARISTDITLINQFKKGTHLPKTVIVINVVEVYIQCARAFMRAGIWDNISDTPNLPSLGMILKAAQDDFDAQTYDQNEKADAPQTLWGIAP